MCVSLSDGAPRGSRCRGLWKCSIAIACSRWPARPGRRTVRRDRPSRRPSRGSRTRSPRRSAWPSPSGLAGCGARRPRSPGTTRSPRPSRHRAGGARTRASTPPARGSAPCDTRRSRRHALALSSSSTPIACSGRSSRTSRQVTAAPSWFARRTLMSAVRRRVLTVPSGMPSASAISRAVSPPNTRARGAWRPESDSRARIAASRSISGSSSSTHSSSGTSSTRTRCGRRPVPAQPVHGQVVGDRHEPRGQPPASRSKRAPCATPRGRRPASTPAASALPAAAARA